MSQIVIASNISTAFLNAIAGIESQGDDAAVNAAEGAHGRYQIRAPYLDDANAILGTAYSLDDMHNADTAERVVRAYLTYYGDAYERRTGQAATPEVLARIHNGGPRGAERDATLPYLEKFRRAGE